MELYFFEIQKKAYNLLHKKTQNDIIEKYKFKQKKQEKKGMKQQKMEELDLKELLEMFWEKKVQIILITLIFMVIGVIYSMAFVTPKYESMTSLLLATSGQEITTTDVTLNSKLVSTYSDLVKSKKVIRNVISNLAIDAGEEENIKNNVSVTAKSDAEIIEITVKNEDAELAAQIANEIAKVFVDNVKEYYGMENLHVVDEAEVAEAPYNVNHAKNVIIFAFIGIVIAVMYVLLANMLDTTIKSTSDIEKISRLTVLASIPLYDAGIDKAGNVRKKGGRR